MKKKYSKYLITVFAFLMFISVPAFAALPDCSAYEAGTPCTQNATDDVTLISGDDNIHVGFLMRFPLITPPSTGILRTLSLTYNGEYAGTVASLRYYCNNNGYEWSETDDDSVFAGVYDNMLTYGDYDWSGTGLKTYNLTDLLSACYVYGNSQLTFFVEHEAYPIDTGNMSSDDENDLTLRAGKTFGGMVQPYVNITSSEGASIPYITITYEVPTPTHGDITIEGIFGYPLSYFTFLMDWTVESGSISSVIVEGNWTGTPTNYSAVYWYGDTWAWDTSVDPPVPDDTTFYVRFYAYSDWDSWGSSDEYYQSVDYTPPYMTDINDEFSIRDWELSSYWSLWGDDYEGIFQVYVESNWTGTPTNYSATDLGGGEWDYHFLFPNATTLCVKWFAVSNSGIWGVAPAWEECSYNEYIISVTCYQETANADTPCGGLDTGSYVIGSNWGGCTADTNDILDGDWESNCEATGDGNFAYLQTTYMKPFDAEGAILMLRLASITANYTIPDDCWSAFGNKVIVVIGTQVNPNNVWLYCYNSGTTFNPMDGTGVETLTLILDGTGTGRTMYEEGIFWANTSPPAPLIPSGFFAGTVIPIILLLIIIGLFLFVLRRVQSDGFGYKEMIEILIAVIVTLAFIGVIIGLI